MTYVEHQAPGTRKRAESDSHPGSSARAALFVQRGRRRNKRRLSGRTRAMVDGAAGNWVPCFSIRRECRPAFSHWGSASMAPSLAVAGGFAWRR